MKLPILLLGFNRPDTIRDVMDAIELYRPTQLFVAVDGPRQSHPTDAANVARVIEVATRPIPGCITKSLVRKDNLGCRPAVSQAIDWFFDQVPAGIILEDDCVASADFFSFCEVLLERYEDDRQVGMIGGTNVLGTYDDANSYLFGTGAVWGWATWASRWGRSSQHQPLRRHALSPKAISLVGLRRWARFSEHSRHVRSGKTSSWAFPWVTTLIRNGSCSVIPTRNLVTNVGFDGSGTHTRVESSLGSVPVYDMSFPLSHPTRVEFNREFDRQWMGLESSILKLWAVRIASRLGVIDRLVALKRRLRR